MIFYKRVRLSHEQQSYRKQHKKYSTKRVMQSIEKLTRLGLINQTESEKNELSPHAKHLLHQEPQE